LARIACFLISNLRWQQKAASLQVLDTSARHGAEAVLPGNENAPKGLPETGGDMFHKVVVPVDLAHEAALQKALQVAATMAKTHAAEVCYVGVGSASPSALARSPAEYKAKLESFAQSQAAQYAIKASAHAIMSHDPATDLNKALEAAIADLQADLVVMATHVPNISDYIWAGHGAHVAAHSTASVLLVRD